MRSPVLLLMLAVIAGSCMDATIKHLVQTNHVLLVTLGRYVFGGLFSLGLYLHAGRPPISADMWRAHGLRGAIIAVSATGFFWSFTVLPLAEAITFSFVGLLVIPFAAWLMLGERLRPGSLIAGAIGFVGVIIATQGAPSPEQSPLHGWGVAAVLSSAVLFAVSMALMRARAQSDGAPIVGLLASVMPALFVAGPTLILSQPPHLADLPAFLLLGVFAAGFMYFMARAYAGAEAQQLAPIHYTELLWASMIGYLLFAEVPRAQIFMGAVLIVAAGVYAAYDERRIRSIRPRA
jgi:drug/metabolite transporter (DMT)-like permease